jgi:hypothetical protein
VDCLRPKYDFGGCRFQHCRARVRLPTRCGSDPCPKPLHSDNPSWVAPGTNVRARWETHWQYRPAPIRPAQNRWTPTQLWLNRQVLASQGVPFVAVRPVVAVRCEVCVDGLARFLRCAYVTRAALRKHIFELEAFAAERLGEALLRPVRQTPVSCAQLGGRRCGRCGERAAASVAARPPPIAVSGGGWPLRSVAISSR